MLPYFAVARMVIALLGSVADSAYYGRWCLLAAAGLKVLFSIWSTSVSHSVTYKTLISKLSRQLKDMIVDRVEGLETTLAHMVPEMTENLLIPICLLVYLFVLDWRMALVSLITLPVGMAFVLIMARTYPAKYEGSVQVSRQMMSEVVEYIGGIEVIKAFNQNAKSYQRYTDAVNADAAYFYNWMNICQWPMSAYTAICPATLLTVLPIGFLFYANGSLSTPDFITIIVLSLGIIGPILAVSNYIDSLAILGTVMNDIGSLLDKPELIRPTEKVKLKGFDHRTARCDVLLCRRRQGDFTRHRPDDQAGECNGAGRPIGQRQEHDRQADRRILGCERRQHPARRAGYEKYPTAPACGDDRLRSAGQLSL